jgi:hypothetical protein
MCIREAPVVHVLADDLQAVLRCEPLLPRLHEGLSPALKLLVDLGNLRVICGSPLGRGATLPFVFLPPEGAFVQLLVTL